MPSAYSAYIQEYENSTAGDEPQRREVAAADFLRQVEARESDSKKNLDLSDDAHESDWRHGKRNEPKRRAERRENTNLRCGSPRTENRQNRGSVAIKRPHQMRARLDCGDDREGGECRPNRVRTRHLGRCGLDEHRCDRNIRAGAQACSAGG